MLFELLFYPLFFFIGLYWFTRNETTTDVPFGIAFMLYSVVLIIGTIWGH